MCVFKLLREYLNRGAQARKIHLRAYYDVYLSFKSVKNAYSSHRLPLSIMTPENRTKNFERNRVLEVVRILDFGVKEGVYLDGNEEAVRCWV
jgi:hypothetical protein